MRQTRTVAPWLLAVIVVLGVGCTPTYNVTDLNTLGAEGYTRAEDINKSGHVTGISRIDATVQHAFLWDGSTISDLGSTAADHFSAGLGINSADHVVGVTTDTLDSGNTAAQVWTLSGRITLPTLGGTEDVAVAINDSDFVVGASDVTGDADFHATAWTGTTPQDLGTLGGAWSFAQDVNSSGHVVGWSLLGPKADAYASLSEVFQATYPKLADLKLVGSFFFPSDMHAFLWETGHPLSDLGTLGGQGSIATAINDLGQVVGVSYLPGDTESHAVLWDGGIHDLSTLGGTESVALDINNNGRIVGKSRTSSGDWRAVVWDHGTPIDLNTRTDSSGMYWVLEEADAINDDGLIVGTGLHHGLSRAFVLRPIPS